MQFWCFSVWSSVSLVKCVTAVSGDKLTCTDVLSVSLPTTVTVPARLHAGRNISMSVQPSRRSSRRPTRMFGKELCLYLKMLQGTNEMKVLLD